MAITTQIVPEKLVALEKSEVLREFQSFVADSVLYDDVKEAYRMCRYLQWAFVKKPALAIEHSDLFDKYQQLLVESQLVSLPLQSEDEIAAFFREHAYFALLYQSIDLWEKLEAKLVRIFIFEQRDPFKARLRAALDANEEQLTDAAITSAGKTILGTVGNWLQDYRKATGGGKISTLVRSEYMVNSFNTKHLSQGDREKVKRLIKVYEQLKYSSLDLDGIEEDYLFEDDKGTWVFKGGRFLPSVDDETKAFMDELERKGLFAYPDLPADAALVRFEQDQAGMKKAVRAAYATPVDSALTKEIEALKKSKRSPTELTELCYNAALPGPGKSVNPGRAIAGLEILAENGKLGILLAPRSRFRTWFEARLRQDGRSADLESLKIHPENDEHIKRFLRYLFQDQLKLEEKRAAQEGARLGNLMKQAGNPAYFNMAYYDAGKKQFVWKE